MHNSGLENVQMRILQYYLKRDRRGFEKDEGR
jgi:hypothetical protein